MCGIAGILCLTPDAPSPTRESLARMAGALEHRGPDEFGVYRDRRAGLAHSRLSIIDLATGQQPMANADGSLWLSFNGEIFNYVELRAELETLGHRFRTKSDTEVILHAWEAWGDAAFEKMNGQWAVALWDSKTGTLVLSRDRLGVRPLYFVEHRGRLVFASEVKALFAGAPDLPRELDPRGLDETFTFWTVVPPQTMFRGVQELEPGHLRVWRQGAPVRDVAFWQPRYPVGDAHRFAGSLEDATAALHHALEEATRLRMVRAEVPVGSYLSGGLDSSVVAALAARAKPSGFKTFSLRFADAEYDETPYQRAMVERLGTEHSEVLVHRQDIAEVFPDVIRFTERPVLRTAPAPLFLLSRLVHRSGIKVVLTGEGSDEMFLGYDLFKETKVRQFWARQPGSKYRPLLLRRLYPTLSVSQQNVELLREFFGTGLETPDALGFSHLVRWGNKVVLTGEGSDELLAGYDLFREAKVRRFWATNPGSTWRPKLLERLYPYLARSPVSQQALTRAFFGRGLERARAPGFSHEPRWHGTAALKRLFSAELRAELGGRDAVKALLSDLPGDFARWPFLAQDQYLEARTLLSGYLLSSQGDRMLMGNSVEGRFPFLDREVIALANSLPPAFKLKVLDEKHVLKRVARELVTPEILSRPKQPYRAPDAFSFVGAQRPAWVDEVMSETALRDAGLFDAKAAAQLWAKCLARKDDSQFSNSDNMAVVGVLSAQLLHRQLVRAAPGTWQPPLKTLVENDAT